MTGKNKGYLRKNYSLKGVLLGTVGIMSIAGAGPALSEDEFFDFDAPPQVVVKPLKNVESICEQYVSRKMKKAVGLNIKATGEEYFLNVGEATISAPVGSENYITSRQNAYEQAVLSAKKNILINMKANVSRKLAYNLSQPKNIIEVPPTASDELETVKRFEDNRDLTSAYNKSLELLNRELDVLLSETEPPKPVETVEEAEQYVQKVLGKSFSDSVALSSFSQLYGVRRVFSLDNSPAGEQGRICVVLVHSDATRAVADGMYAQDASLLPAGKPGKPLYWNQIPNPDTAEGVTELLNTFGVDMVRDENGDFVLVSYAQAGVAIEGDQDAIVIAKNIARDRAIAGLRSFMGEVAVLKNAGEFSEEAAKYKDGSSDYSFNNAYETDIKSTSKEMEMVGISQGRSWGVKHPVTNQTIVGTWVEWSSKTLSASKRAQQQFNQQRPAAQPSSGANSGNGQSSSSGASSSTNSSGMVGGAGRGTSEDDF
jgi:hypothetical protein